MSEAFITRKLTNQTIIDWLTDQSGLKVTIGKPLTDDIDWDLAVVDDKKEGKGLNQIEVLRPKNFNRQQSWYQSGKPLKEWNDGPFHYGNKIVMATWLCGQKSVDGITFLDVSPEEVISSSFQKRSFRSVMRSLIEEFGFGLRYTAESQLFSELGAAKFDISTSNVSVDPIDLPYAETLTDNYFGDKKIGSQKRIQLRNDEASVKAYIDDKVYECVSFISKQNRDQNSTKFLLMEPNKKDYFRMSIENGVNRHEIYILSHQVRLKLASLKDQFGVDNYSSYVRGFLAFGIGTRFSSIQTKDIYDQIGHSQSKLVKAVSKNENITHV